MGFVRTLPLEKHLSETAAAKITAMYGHDRWRAIYDRRRAGAINPEAARTEYVQLYAQGLRELGYEHVQERQITKEGVGGRAGSPMYFLIHASDHDAGERIIGPLLRQETHPPRRATRTGRPLPRTRRTAPKARVTRRSGVTAARAVVALASDPTCGHRAAGRRSSSARRPTA
jgi:hypothetical protein